MIELPCKKLWTVVSQDEANACERMARDRKMSEADYLRSLLQQQIRYDQLVTEWSERGGFKIMAPGLPTDDD